MNRWFYVGFTWAYLTNDRTNVTLSSLLWTFDQWTVNRSIHWEWLIDGLPCERAHLDRMSSVIYWAIDRPNLSWLYVGQCIFWWNHLLFECIEMDGVIRELSFERVTNELGLTEYLTYYVMRNYTLEGWMIVDMV